MKDQPFANGEEGLPGGAEGGRFALRALTLPPYRNSLPAMTKEIDALRDRFEQVYHLDAAGAARAPGRVNLIGEHTDYNDGFVLPIAIERETVALYAPRKDRVVRFTSLQAHPSCRIDLDGPVAAGEPKWANYPKGVAALLAARGVALAGADILFSSDVPLGGGLSSSASLEVAAALALMAAAGQSGAVEGRDLALLCQQAEHQYAGSPCGIMDQSVVAMGQAGHAMLLDCRSGEIQHVPQEDPNVVILVADTQVKHEIGGGAYAQRRSACHAVAQALGAKALRDVDESQLEGALKAGRIQKEAYSRALHAVRETARTLQAADALRGGDYRRFGALMYESHESLRALYEVSCAELDAIVELARSCQGVYGSRMTGGGFGGCAIILARAAEAAPIGQAVAEGFSRRFGRACPIFATRPAPGASLLR